MAKATVRATSDLKELASDLYSLADALPEEMLKAGEAQLQVLESAIKTNWVSMVPWSKAGDYVWSSIGYNIDYGNDGDVVGMAGVFLVDSISAEFGKGPHDIKAPNIAYWAEHGFTDFNGKSQSGHPFLSNALYMSYNQQDYAFAEVLDKLLTKRLG